MPLVAFSINELCFDLHLEPLIASIKPNHYQYHKSYWHHNNHVISIITQPYPNPDQKSISKLFKKFLRWWNWFHFSFNVAWLWQYLQYHCLLFMFSWNMRWKAIWRNQYRWHLNKFCASQFLILFQVILHQVNEQNTGT